MRIDKVWRTQVETCSNIGWVKSNDISILGIEQPDDSMPPRAVAQSVEVPGWCNSSDVGSNPGCGIR